MRRQYVPLSISPAPSGHQNLRLKFVVWAPSMPSKTSFWGHKTHTRGGRAGSRVRVDWGRSGGLESLHFSSVGVWGREGAKMKTNLGDIGNKAKRTELYRKQKGDKKAEQKERRRRREREAQELGEVSLVAHALRCGRSVFFLSEISTCRVEVCVCVGAASSTQQQRRLGRNIGMHASLKYVGINKEENLGLSVTRSQGKTCGS